MKYSQQREDLIHIKINLNMANIPNNPDDDRNRTSNPAQDSHQNDRGVPETKQPDPANQPTRKTDPSGSAFNTEDDYTGEEE